MDSETEYNRKAKAHVDALKRVERAQTNRKPKSKPKVGRGEMASVRSRKIRSMPKRKPIGRRGVSKSGSKYGSGSGPKRRGK